MTTDHIPPMIDGVCASTLYLPKLNASPPSLFAYLCNKFSHIGADQWRQRFLTQQILDSTGKALDIDTPYHYGTHIYYYRFVADEPHVPFEHRLIFENDNIMVVDKPHFLTVAPAGNYVRQTLLSRLKQTSNNPHLAPIHRLDKDTAGLILISKNPATRHLYQALFRQQRVHKVYHAIAKIHPNLSLPTKVSLHLERGTPFYVMQVNPHKSANSTTHLDILCTKNGWAKYQLTPTTGKLHQLRAHLNHLGIPIKNDPYYPSITHQAANEFDNPLQLLAKSLAFYEPIDKRDVAFVSPRELCLPT